MRLLFSTKVDEFSRGVYSTKHLQITLRTKCPKVILRGVIITNSNLDHNYYYLIVIQHELGTIPSPEKQVSNRFMQKRDCESLDSAFRCDEPNDGSANSRAAFGGNTTFVVSRGLIMHIFDGFLID